MARLNHILYFAPKVRFKAVDLTGTRLPTQIYQRIYGFYLEPAIRLAISNDAFASGLLSVCAMDHLGHLLTGAGGVGARFKDCCRRIPELASGDTPDLFYRHFRNGLVHEARIGNAGEFDLNATELARRHGDRLIVNPLLLAQALQTALKDCIANVYKQRGMQRTVANNIRLMFRSELHD